MKGDVLRAIQCYVNKKTYSNHHLLIGKKNSSHAYLDTVLNFLKLNSSVHSLGFHHGTWRFKWKFSFTTSFSDVQNVRLVVMLVVDSTLNRWKTCVCPRDSSQSKYFKYFKSRNFHIIKSCFVMWNMWMFLLLLWRLSFVKIFHI